MPSTTERARRRQARCGGLTICAGAGCCGARVRKRKRAFRARCGRRVRRGDGKGCWSGVDEDVFCKTCQRNGHVQYSAVVNSAGRSTMPEKTQIAHRVLALRQIALMGGRVATAPAMCSLKDDCQWDDASECRPATCAFQSCHYSQRVHRNGTCAGTIGCPGTGCSDASLAPSHKHLRPSGPLRTHPISRVALTAPYSPPLPRT